MSFSNLVGVIQSSVDFADLPETLPDGASLILPPGAVSSVVSLVASSSAGKSPILVICATGRESDHLRDELRSALPPEIPVFDFPSWETLPHELLSPHPATVARRRAAVQHLNQSSRRSVVVAPVRALLQPVNPDLDKFQSRVARVGDSAMSMDSWVSYLAEAGYSRVDLVSKRGEYAVRGGILDVFPPLADHPVRLDFFGAELEEVTFFGISDQRSLNEKITSIRIDAVKEIFLTEEVKFRASELAAEFPGLETILSKLAAGIFCEGMESLQPILLSELVPPIALFPEDTVLIEVSSQKIRARSQLLHETNREFLQAAWEVAALEGEKKPVELERGHFLTYEELRESAGSRVLFSLDHLDTGADENFRLPLDALPLSGYSGEDVWSFINDHVRARGLVIILAAGNGLVERAADLLGERDIPHRIDLNLDKPLGAGVVSVVQGFLREGFLAPKSNLIVLTETELFGKPISASVRSGRILAPKRARVVDPLQLSAGDYVVHETHGLGRFVELILREISTGGRTPRKSEREFVVLEYAPSRRGRPFDRLFVPTDQLNQLSHYVGSDKPTLSKMGGSDWATSKKRARKAVRELAVDLVKLYAARMAAPGFAFSPDTPWQRELEEAFPFLETADQLTTIQQVKADMERPIPMDRLVAGDVGFGKTEIAVRAAFKAVQDGRQVALIAPTTLLVKQHMETFGERFSPFPVNLRALSRFQKQGEAVEVRAGLSDGSIDVVIGTHRLLAQSVKFRNLGLVIVDEEQRFGVEHKDSLKALKTNVDVLAMSATPIPRTLEMAVTGIREMSTLATPPESRNPVLTFVGPYNEARVSAAIRRELLREGQIFFVHNRVSTISSVASRVAQLVPEAKVGIAHGQLSENMLEQVMDDFWEKKFDVLVCTTIIETGLDISNANTLIVDRAERFGLSQLHQLRGRVGRGRERGYAYLFYENQSAVPEAAHERLATLAATTELGGGTRIAMKDLEMRGAGNLLGADQSGHIQGVGFDLYLRMMGEAIALFREEVAPGQIELRLELPIDARIPLEFVDSERLRLELYQKLANAAAPTSLDDEIEQICYEIKDRYGEPPESLQILIEATRVRRMATMRGVSEAVVSGNKLRLVGPPLSESRQLELRRLFPKSTYFEPARALVVPLPADFSDRKLIEWVEDIICSAYGKPERTSEA